MNTALKNILITGASSGIGEALAYHYAVTPGACLYLTGRNEERLDNVAGKCRKLGATCHAKTIDVTNRKAMHDWILDIDKNTPLDLVIANAGISGGTGGENTVRNYDTDLTIMDINLGGVMNTMHPVLPLLTERQKGQIAIISSMASFAPMPGAPAYSASKAAVRFYGEALGVKLKKENVFVSVICPGFIESRITENNSFPMPFMMSADKAARIIANGIEKKKIRVDFPWPMKIVMAIIHRLPSFFVRDVFSRVPEKK